MSGEPVIPNFGGAPLAASDVLPGFGTPTPPAAAGGPVVPSFGPSPVSPPMPPGGPMAPPAPHHNLSDLLSAVPAILAGLKNPVEAGAALAGLRIGQDRARERTLTNEQRQEKRAQDTARFTSDVVTHAQGFDDEIALHQYLAAIKPMADYYGVDLSGFSISDEKKSAKDRGMVQDALDKAIKRHGAEILNNDQASIQLSDGRTFSMPVARQMMGGAVSQNGQAIPVPSTTKPDLPNTPEEQFYAQYAKEQGAKSFRELSTADQGKAREQWAKSGRADPGEKPQRVEGLLDGKPAFVFQTGTHFQDSSGADVTARFRPLQTPSERPSNGEPVVAVDNGDGTVTYVPRSQVAGRTVRKTTPAPTQAQYQDAAYASRINDAAKVLDGIEPDITGMNYATFTVQGRLPAAAQSSTFQSYDQAARNLVNAILRRESGAAISASEFENAKKQYLPQPGDTPQVLAQKRQNRQRVADNMERAAGAAASGSDAQPAAAVVKWGRDAQGRPVRLP